MKKYLLLLFALFLIFSIRLLSQNTFVRTYGFSFQQKSAKIFEIENNFLFVTNVNQQAVNSSSIELIKLNSFGDTLLTKSINIGEGSYVIDGIKSGNSIVLAINYSESYGKKTALLKIDSKLNEVWLKRFSKDVSFVSTALIETDFNSIAVCGNLEMKNGRRSFYIQKLNSSGEELLFKEIDLGLNCYISGILEKENKSFILCGQYETKSSFRKFLVCQTDSNCENVIHKSYNFGVNSGAVFIRKWQQNFAIGGFAEDSTRKKSDGVILFVDQDLDSASSYIFNHNLNQTLFSATTDSKNLIVSGNVRSSSSIYGDVFILKFDRDNKFVNSKIFEGICGNHVGSNITTTNDGSLLIGTTSYNCTALLIKADQNGDVLQAMEIERAHSKLVNHNSSIGKFYFDGNDKVKKGIVYSLNGSIVQEFGINEIDLSQMANGIYFYKVEYYSGQVQTGKLINIRY